MDLPVDSGCVPVDAGFTDDVTEAFPESTETRSLSPKLRAHTEHRQSWQESTDAWSKSRELPTTGEISVPAGGSSGPVPWTWSVEIAKVCYATASGQGVVGQDLDLGRSMLPVFVVQLRQGILTGASGCCSVLR